MCPFDYTAVAVSGKVGPVNEVNHTSWVAVTPTDRHKSVRNRCVFELFCGVVCVVTLPFGVWAFVIGLSQIPSFFSWNFVPMKYSWFAAHVNVIRANVSSMVVTLVSDWFHYFNPTAAWISKKYSKSIVCVLCCSVYKDDRTGFWLADTLSNSQQPLHRMARDFL